MKKTLVALSTAFALCLVTQPCFADSGAGCGLGKVILDGKSGKGANLAAAIINVILIPNTLFMSTAASMGEELLGCDPTQQVLKEQQKNVFVAANMDNLSRDMAQGSGAHLEALATAMGIADADRASFYQTSQDAYAGMDPAMGDSPASVAAALNVAMLERPELVKYLQ